MATIGAPLASPEPGYRRYDDKDSRFLYSGFISSTDTSSNGGTHVYSAKIGDYILFKFYGTKLRIISPTNYGWATAARIIIDGVEETFNEYSATIVYKALVYEKTDLSSGVHTVKIIVPDTKQTGFDCIDIDDTGYLVHPTLNQVSSLDNMSIGDCIPFRYTATTSGAPGYFSELGSCITTEIPVTGSATSDGLAYFTKVDKGLLICDRVVQHSIAWNTLNNNKYIEGNILASRKKVTLGYGTCFIEYDSNYIYIVNQGNMPTAGTLSIISKSTLSVYKTITVGVSARGIYIDDNYIYVSNGNSQTISVISKSTLQLTKTISIGISAYGINGDDNYVYIADFASNKIVVVSKFTLALLSTKTISGTSNGYRQILVVGNYIYLGGITNYIYRVDKSTFIADKSILLQAVPGYIVTDINNEYMYSSQANSNYIAIINLSTHEVEYFQTDSSMYFTIGTNKKLLGDYIYLQGYSSNSYTVKIFSTSQKKIINSFTLDMIPYSIAYDDKYIYVTNFLSAGCVSILDRQFIENSYMIRCLSGGNSYLGTDGKSSLTNKSLGGWPTNNEWDKYIVKSDLNGKITPGDNNIWHYNHIWSNTQNSSINGTWVNPLGVTYNRDSSLKIIRGNMNGQLNADWKDIGHSSIEYAATTSGFRPVLQYLEPDSKQTNSWY